MTRKMTAPPIVVMTIGLLSAGGCARWYVASGLRGDFDLSGSFVVRAQPVANDCSEVRMDEVESRLDVQHATGDLKMTVVFEGDPYLGSVQRNGKFVSEAMQRSRGGTTETITMRGQFRDSTFSASLDVKRNPVRTTLPTSRPYMSRACRYHVNVSGTRVTEAR